MDHVSNLFYTFLTEEPYTAGVVLLYIIVRSRCWTLIPALGVPCVLCGLDKVSLQDLYFSVIVW